MFPSTHWARHSHGRAASCCISERAAFIADLQPAAFFERRRTAKTFTAHFRGGFVGSLPASGPRVNAHDVSALTFGRVGSGIARSRGEPLACAATIDDYERRAGGILEPTVRALQVVAIDAD
jgi:hypothetical protein